MRRPPAGRRRRAGRLVVAGTAAVLVAAGVAVWVMTRGSGDSYRTADVAYASVAQTVGAVGTVRSVNQASVSFSVSGQVAAVPVTLGQQVSAGQVLATLSTGIATQQLAQANQALANDQQRLAADQAAQASPTQAPTGSSGDATASAYEQPLTTPVAAAPPLPSSNSASTTTAAAQAQLTKDQKALDAILTDDSLKDLLALTNASGPCTPTADTTDLSAISDGSGAVTITTTLPAAITVGGTALTESPTRQAGAYVYLAPGHSPNTGYPVTITEQVTAPATCTAAIATLVADLDPNADGGAWALTQAINADELRLAAAITALGSESSVRSAPSTSGDGHGSAAAPVPAQARSAPATAAQVTPQQIAADQAAVDSANAQVAVAQQNLDQATLTSPIAGTIEDITLSTGASAAGNAITVIGPGAHEITTTVPLSAVDLVKVGDAATVDVDGVARPLTGKVSAIGILSTTTGTSTSYPVTVLLGASPARLFDGAGAAVSIAVASVDHVLTVPSSALHTVGEFASVSVLTGGKARTTRVGVGVIGRERTQITSGLTAGQQVVLAQLNAPLPSPTNPLAGLRGTGLGRAGRGGGGGNARPGG